GHRALRHSARFAGRTVEVANRHSGFNSCSVNVCTGRRFRLPELFHSPPAPALSGSSTEWKKRALFSIVSADHWGVFQKPCGAPSIVTISAGTPTFLQRSIISSDCAIGTVLSALLCISRIGAESRSRWVTGESSL